MGPFFYLSRPRNMDYNFHTFNKIVRVADCTGLKIDEIRQENWPYLFVK